MPSRSVYSPYGALPCCVCPFFLLPHPPESYKEQCIPISNPSSPPSSHYLPIPRGFINTPDQSLELSTPVSHGNRLDCHTRLHRGNHLTSPLSTLHSPLSTHKTHQSGRRHSERLSPIIANSSNNNGTRAVCVLYI
jgi:hypothetical protein